MRAHCRCKYCRHRKKLKRMPSTYDLQPKCGNCGARSWTLDSYRHRVELPQIRSKTGRYKVCHCDGYHHAHRTGFGECKFLLSGEYKDFSLQAGQ